MQLDRPSLHWERSKKFFDHANCRRIFLRGSLYFQHDMKAYLTIYRLFFLALCGWTILAPSAYAASRALDASQINAAPVSLTEYFSVLDDPSLTLTLADVQKSPIAASFKSDFAPAEGFNFGFTHSAHWLRLTLHNESDQAIDRILEIKFGRISSVQFHQPDSTGEYQSIFTGNALPFATRPYPNRYFVFPIALPARSTQVLYLRVQSVGWILVPAKLWRPNAFYAHERNDYLGQAWYFGMATAMAIFNLLLFIVLRDRVYLLYVSFVTSFALALGAQSGLAKEFLWPDARFWAEIAPIVGYSLTCISMLLFMRYLLSTWKTVPRLDRLIKWLAWLLVVSPLGYVISPQVFAKPTLLIYIATTLLTTVTAIYCAYRRQRSAYFFLAAFAVLFVTATLSSLAGLLLLPATIMTNNLLQFGSATEMLLLALALADRIKVFRREKEIAQQEVLAAQNRLLESLKNTERVLEDQVQHRTLALSASNQALKIANQELERLSVTDRLTGLYNRLLLDKVLDDEFNRNQRYASTFSLVLLDIDKFKSVNDTHGHPVGDLVLMNIAQVLREGTRDVDIVGRWGGEEFLVVCRDTALDGAASLAEKLRHMIAEHDFPVIGSRTASFGVTVIKLGDTIASLIARADKALYQAKEDGRNRVCCEA